MSCRLWLFMCSRLSISSSGAWYHCVTIHHIGHYNHKTFHFQNWQLFSSPFCTTEADCLSQSFIYFVIHHSVLKLFFSCVSRSFWILLVFQYMCSPSLIEYRLQFSSLLFAIVPILWFINTVSYNSKMNMTKWSCFCWSLSSSLSLNYKVEAFTKKPHKIFTYY